jgi:hypothetical protein
VVILATALEAPAVVSGFDDIAVVSEAVQQGRCHFGVGENARPYIPHVEDAIWHEFWATIAAERPALGC